MFRGSRSHLEADRAVPGLATNLHDLCRRASQLHLHGATDLYRYACSVFQSRVLHRCVRIWRWGVRDHRPDHCGGWRRVVKKPYGLGVRVQEKFQQKSRPRRWCWGSSGEQTTGALMCVSICSCPSDQTHGLGPPTCPQRWHWKVVLSFPWKRPGAHINELELRALFTLLRGLARSSGNIGMRFAVLVDSLIVLGIAAKGRSCSLTPTQQMNHQDATNQRTEARRTERSG